MHNTFQSWFHQQEADTWMYLGVRHITSNLTPPCGVHQELTFKRCFVAVFAISAIIAAFPGLYHFPLQKHRNRSSKQQTWLLRFPPLQYCKQGCSKTSTCPKLLSMLRHAFSSFFSLSAASKIIALASCALSHYFQHFIYTTSISKFQQEIPDSYAQPVITLFTFLG